MKKKEIKKAKLSELISRYIQLHGRGCSFGCYNEEKEQIAKEINKK